MKKIFAALGLAASLALISSRLYAHCGHCGAGESHEKHPAAGCAECEKGRAKKEAAKPKAPRGKAAKRAAKKEKLKSWACPMGCAVSEKPGKCPKCGMDLTEKK
ncbi:MAG: hypothetical protein HY403_06735 [Elusimicrobia bacterium]|nr:hypothetical protein [Elusimicrobiota bacterium]